jgi:carbon-monoxide dehydrogenase small subunit
VDVEERGYMTVETRKIILNGSEAAVEAEAQARLIDVLRNVLGLHGTKEGCGEGECGACSVILNGAVINSCLMLFGQLTDGDKLLTIEGVAAGGELHPIQRCFIDEGGVQCGMCTPGMVMAAYVLLENNKNPSRSEIAAALSGNLCRCTGYQKIIASVEKAAAMMRGGK